MSSISHSPLPQVLRGVLKIGKSSHTTIRNLTGF